MTYGEISAEISDEVVDQLIRGLKDMELKFPFAISLAPEEVRSLPKMGDKSIPFVEKSLEFATQHTQFVPPYLDIEELKKDFALAMKLRKILNVLEPLTERVRDTFIAAGADAFTAARVFYHSVKKARELNIPGADAIAEELGKRYS